MTVQSLLLTTILVALSAINHHATVIAFHLPDSPCRPSTALLNKRPKAAASKGGGGFGKVTSMNIRKKKVDYTGSLRPHPQSPQVVVDPDTVLAFPDYALDGVPKKKGSSQIEIKTAQDIECMRAAGRAAREVLDIAGRMVKAGITTDEIDKAVHAACLERKAYPSPLNYRKFPKSCCTSVNEVICHGIPDSRPLESGDIINIDITVYLNGYHGDCSEMFVVGGKEALDEKGRTLIQTTYDSWISAMEVVKPGVDYNAIGRVIQEHVQPRGYSTVRSFCGHGIGSTFHTAPNIYHYTVNQPLGEMEAGHVFTIEPMICEGVADPFMWDDNWTATTRDGGRSAQFEHTLLVTEDGVEALTGKIEGSPVQFWEAESTIKKGVWVGSSTWARERAEELNKNLSG
jgi:methionyl aminopeptidase